MAVCDPEATIVLLELALGEVVGVSVPVESLRVGIAEGVADAEGLGDTVCVAVCDTGAPLKVGVADGVTEGVAEGVADGELDAEGVGVPVGVGAITDALGVSVALTVAEGVAAPVAEGLGEPEGVDPEDALGVGDVVCVALPEAVPLGVVEVLGVRVGEGESELVTVADSVTGCAARRSRSRRKRLGRI